MEPIALEEWLSLASSSAPSAATGTSAAATTQGAGPQFPGTQIVHAWAQIRAFLQQRRALTPADAQPFELLTEHRRVLHLADSQAKLLQALLSEVGSSDGVLLGFVRRFAVLGLLAWVRRSFTSSPATGTSTRQPPPPETLASIVQSLLKALEDRPLSDQYLSEGILLLGILSTSQKISPAVRSDCLSGIARELMGRREVVSRGGAVAEALAGVGYALSVPSSQEHLVPIFESLLMLWAQNVEFSSERKGMGDLDREQRSREEDGSVVKDQVMLLHLMDFLGSSFLSRESSNMPKGSASRLGLELVQTILRVLENSSNTPNARSVQSSSVMASVGLLRSLYRWDAANRKRGSSLSTPAHHLTWLTAMWKLQTVVIDVCEQALVPDGEIRPSLPFCPAGDRYLCRCVSVAVSRCRALPPHPAILRCLLFSVFGDALSLPTLYSGFASELAAGGILGGSQLAIGGILGDNQLAQQGNAAPDAPQANTSQEAQQANASQETHQGNASQEIHQGNASQETQKGNASEETHQGNASQEAHQGNASQETQQSTASEKESQEVTQGERVLPGGSMGDQGGNFLVFQRHVDSFLLKEMGALVRVMCDQYRAASGELRGQTEALVAEYARNLYERHRSLVAVSQAGGTEGWVRYRVALEKVLETAFMTVIIFFSTAVSEQGVEGNERSGAELAALVLDSLSCVEFFRRVRLREFSTLIQLCVSRVSGSEAASVLLAGWFPARQGIVTKPGTLDVSRTVSWGQDEVQTSRVLFYFRVLPLCLIKMPEATFAEEIAPAMLLYLQHPSDTVCKAAHALFAAFLSLGVGSDEPPVIVGAKKSRSISRQREMTSREQLAMDYMRTALQGFPGSTPFQGLVAGAGAIAQHLPPGSPATIYCLDCLVNKTAALYGSDGSSSNVGETEGKPSRAGTLGRAGAGDQHKNVPVEEVGAAQRLQVLLLHLVLLVDVQVFPVLLKLLAKLILGLPKPFQMVALAETFDIVGFANDYIRKPLIVPWLQSLSFLARQSQPLKVKGSKSPESISVKVSSPESVSMSKSVDEEAASQDVVGDNVEEGKQTSDPGSNVRHSEDASTGKVGSDTEQAGLSEKRVEPRSKL